MKKILTLALCALCSLGIAYAQESKIDKSGNTSAEVVAGMKYRDYKNLYDTKYYVPQSTDPYSRGWAGVASFFIPGLGQGVAGEWGRGAIFFGANVAMGVAQYLDTSYDNGRIKMGALGWTMCVARIALDIWSICDAVHVAKVKNMYWQDISSKNASLDFRLEPYFACAPTGTPGLSQPAAGLSMKLAF